jgi:hypothetical protein
MSTIAEHPAPPRRCVGIILHQLATLTRELVETARRRARAGDESAELAFYSAAERVVEVARGDDPLPVPPTGQFPKETADAFQTILASVDMAMAGEVSVGRVDGQTVLCVLHAIRDAVAETDPELAARLAPRLTAMVTF